MSAPIGPGDWVECVDLSDYWFEVYTKPPVLRLHSIYRVSRIFADSYGEVVELFEFLGRDERGVRPCFDVRRFRPIYSPKADTFTHLLTDIPEYVWEDA